MYLQNVLLMAKVEHAVSASTVYLIRSLGSVWGVAITATIVQNTLQWRLPNALAGIPDKERVRLYSLIHLHTP